MDWVMYCFSAFGVVWHRREMLILTREDQGLLESLGWGNEDDVGYAEGRGKLRSREG